MPTNEGVGFAGMRNELTHRGAARFVSTLSEIVPRVLENVDDITIFRGDSTLSSGGGGRVVHHGTVNSMRFVMRGQSCWCSR